MCSLRIAGALKFTFNWHSFTIYRTKVIKGVCGEKDR